MPQLGIPEIFVILVIALVVFGPQRLPEIGRQVGKALAEVRRMQAQLRSQLDEVIGDLDPPSIIGDGPVERRPVEQAAPQPAPPRQRAPHVSAVDPGAARPATNRFRAPAPTPPAQQPPSRPSPAAGAE